MFVKSLFQHSLFPCRQYALGYTTNKMDVTVDGFVSWMWKNLGFLLPLLVLSYIGELFLAHKLLVISRESYCTQWQPKAISILLGTMCIGNIVTVCILIKRKLGASKDLRNFSFGKYTNVDSLFGIKSNQLSKLYANFKKSTGTNNNGSRSAVVPSSSLRS